MHPKTVVILESDADDRCVVCEALQHLGFESIEVRSLEALKETLNSGNPLAVIIDIDMDEISTRFIKALTIRYPDTVFLGLSEKLYHPQLKEVICYHMWACMRKPVDYDEVCYIVSSIYHDSKPDP